MAEIDPIILRLIADNRQYRVELARTTRIVNQELERQRRQVEALERQIRQSSGAIGGSFRGLAATFAAAFSVQRIAEYADSYTRFTNQLKVAGLEGEKLGATQEALFGIAQRYGVQLESLGTLYGRAAANQKELGATSKELERFTSGVSAALKIQGASASDASGALLQLSQLLGSSRVMAEEFNSVNEGARPILQAVASNIDAAGGSVSRLKAMVTSGKVSNTQFFEAFLKGSELLERQAASAQLTIGNSFTILNNALGKYIGEADQSLSATDRISQAIVALSNNLDTVTQAIAVLSTLLLGRFASSLLGAAGNLGIVSAAIFAAQARAAGAATTMEALAFAGAAAGRTLLAAFGGTVGLAVTALGLGLLYVTTQTEKAASAADIAAKAQANVADVTNKAAEAADRLASAHGKAREEAMKQARAEYENIKQKLASARASVVLAAAEYNRAKAGATAENMGFGSFGSAGAVTNRAANRDAEGKLQNLRVAEAEAGRLFASLLSLEATIKAPETATVATGDGKKKKGRTRSGPSAADIEAQFASDMRRALAEQLQDQLEITTDIDRRRELQTQLNDIEYDERLAQIQAEKNYSAKQKAALTAALNKRFGKTPSSGDDITVTASPMAVALAREYERARTEREQRALRDQQDTLAAEADLLDNRRDRLAIERRILELAQEEERQRLEASITAGDIADATEARANLERRQTAERSSLGRQYESPIERYRREISGNNLQDDVEALVVDELKSVQEGINDAITSRLGVKDPLLAGLLDLFIQQNIMRPLAEGFSGGRGGGGVIGSIFGSIFGRASGGYVGPGSLTRVNENRGGVELLRMGPQGGQVIPLGQATASPASQRITIEVHAEEGALFRPVVQGIATRAAVPVAVEVVNRAAPGIAQAGAGLAATQAAKQQRYGG